MINLRCLTRDTGRHDGRERLDLRCKLSRDEPFNWTGLVAMMSLVLDHDELIGQPVDVPV